MKSIIICFFLICFSFNSAFAGCDWSKIKKNSDNTFTYPEDLHLCVGHLVQDNATKDQQIQDLTKAISLKDLAIKDSDSRVLLWMNTANSEQDRLNKISETQKHMDFIYFGLGVIAALGAGYMASKLIAPR